MTVSGFPLCKEWKTISGFHHLCAGLTDAQQEMWQAFV